MAVTAFFYGTLMHPKILQAVIKNDGAHLKICPAVLLDYTRHKVKFADYPGILPLSKGIKLFDRNLTREEASVRGTLIMGLTDQDIKALDQFEGDEYIIRTVQVHPLDSFKELATYATDGSTLIPSDLPTLPFGSNNPSYTMEAQAYIYRDPNDLMAELWSFQDFVQHNAWKWYSGNR